MRNIYFFGDKTVYCDTTDKVYVADDDGNVKVYNLPDCRKRREVTSKEYTCYQLIANVICIKNKLWVLFLFDPDVYIIDLNDNSIDVIENTYANDYITDGYDCFYFMAKQLNDRQIVTFRYKSAKVYVIDIYEYRIEEYLFPFSIDNVVDNKWFEMIQKYRFYGVDDVMLLNRSIEFNRSQSYNMQFTDIGNAIYKKYCL